MSKSEAHLLNELILHYDQKGLGRLFRNNRGACYDQTGRLIRYGLANESKAVDKVLKSSDLIGITKMIITPEDVGRTVAVFTSFEVKRENWQYKGTDREEAQRAWIRLIRGQGGIARFITDIEEVGE